MAIVWRCALSVSEYAVAGKGIEVPKLSCSRCEVALEPWGWYARWVRDSERHRIWVRRVRCRWCGVSDALLPDFVLARRLDVVDVIGRAIELTAEGMGTWRSLLELDRPFSTVRDWRSRLRERAPELLQRLAAVALQVGAEVGELPTKTLPATVAVLKAVWSRSRERAPEMTAGPWRFWNAICSGQGLASPVNASGGMARNRPGGPTDGRAGRPGHGNKGPIVRRGTFERLSRSHELDVNRLRLRLTAMVRIDLHLHTSASFDCSVEPRQILRRCRALGLGPVAITDHDTIDGARELAELHSWPVVIGQEITTTEGELIGLFLRERIPLGLTARKAALRIKDQGGLVYLQHPYDALRRHAQEEAIEAIADLIDIVEVFNGRSDEEANCRAEDLCQILRAAPGAGSDAHTLAELGSVYTELEDFRSARELSQRLHESRIVRRPSRWRLWVEARLHSPAGRQ